MANSFKNKGAAVGTSATTIYTVPASTVAVIHAIFAANVDGTYQRTVTLQWVDSSASTTYRLAYNAPIPAGGTLVFDKPVNLETGDYIQALADTAPGVEVTLSILEVA